MRLFEPGHLEETHQSKTALNSTGLKLSRDFLMTRKLKHCQVLCAVYSLRVRFFKKIQDWILKYARIRKRILSFFINQINPRSLGSWCVKGTK